MQQHTLLATTGASPQVVTETLYAIHQANQRWPDDIYLITTSFGKKEAIKGLINGGHLQRLCHELKRPMPAFDDTHVLVAPGADGNEVDDARSLADHEALANFIMTEVRNRTSDAGTSLHASLAGGRKTMTFYIGYAMSLFGRVQDTLSHVLVSEGYENIPDFWFPTDSVAHRHVMDNKQKKLDAAAAIVTLAPIPFICHRHALPRVLLQNQTDLNFVQLVRLINLGEKPEEIFLTLDMVERSITVADAQKHKFAQIKLGELELPFYAMILRASKGKLASLTRPKGKEDSYGTFLADLFLEEMLPLYGLSAHQTDRKRNLGLLADCDQLTLKTATLRTLENGITPTFFSQRINEIKECFEQQLPKSISRWLEPTVIWEETDEETRRIPLSKVDSTSKGSGYGIFLNPENISIRS